MPFVLDCSMTMAWVFPDEADERTEALRASLLEDSALVPSLWPIEVANVVLAATRRGRLQEEEWPQLFELLSALPITLDDETPHRAWKDAMRLASRLGLSVYDGVYVELAQRTELPLATLDLALRRAAESAGIPVL